MSNRPISILAYALWFVPVFLFGISIGSYVTFKHAAGEWFESNERYRAAAKDAWKYARWRHQIVTGQEAEVVKALTIVVDHNVRTMDRLEAEIDADTERFGELTREGLAEMAIESPEPRTNGT